MKDYFRKDYYIGVIVVKPILNLSINKKINIKVIRCNECACRITSGKITTLM